MTDSLTPLQALGQWDEGQLSAVNQWTHYVPILTRHKNLHGTTYEQTVCGLFISQSAIARPLRYPSCPKCREWLGIKEDE